MIIDAHIHIFPPEMVLNREKFFSDEPEFKILYNNPKAKLATMETALEMLDECGVDAAVACGFPWRTPGHFKMHNDYLATAKAKHPHKFAVMGAFHTQAKDAEAEARRCLELNMDGLGELAFYQEPINETALTRLAPIMQLYAAAGLPVLLHANEPIGHLYPGKAAAEISDYYNLCKKFPQNRIILAHWGGGLLFYMLLKREVKETLQNVWFDTAASPFLYEDNIYSIFKNILPYERILFGSDFPLLKPTRYLSAVRSSNLPAAAQNAILGLNAKKLFIFQNI